VSLGTDAFAWWVPLPDGGLKRIGEPALASTHRQIQRLKTRALGPTNTDKPMPKTIVPTEELSATNFEIDEIATDLILEHGAMILQDARRYSSCLADAEDAYQRSLVIMLTKAPSADPAELIPWLRVVVRREAADIARERSRVLSKSFDDLANVEIANEALPEEHVLDTFDVELGVEALAKLKPDQIRCLLAQADGRSYAEISLVTGFSARKVARNVNEGRRAFMKRVQAIESGSECERLDKLLPEIASGDEIALDSVRNHLKNCSGCRTAVREYNDAPRHAAVLFPPALVATATAANAGTSPFGQIAAAWNELIDKLTVHAHGAQQWAEVGTYKKVAAVAAITASVASGGAAVKHLESRDRPTNGDRAATSAHRETAKPTTHLLDEVHVAQAPKRKVERHRRRKKQNRPTPVAAAPQPVSPQQVSSENEPIGDGSSEFLPEQR
jgi:RNA polymerase sigma factor (sigma-70 family)